ncbi:unnamed protein product, partial [Mesorhabditis belari]|uniref:Protein kinase domain-containing protein n=1 Tax=Mesorhabditis belari TaxID=2138241 RepID=A0AAF3J903_9BILA
MDTLVVETHPIGQGGNGAVYKLIGYQPPAVIKYLINVNEQQRLGFVHKDVKPGNVFITKDWTVKLGDFGSVRACDGTSIEAFRGTIRYSVPDQIGIPELGENPTEEEKELRKRCYHRNDVYSLGLVLWELIERRQVYSNYEKVDGYNGKMFNESLFYSFIQANKQFDLEPINCIEELKVIFENATKFLALERSDAMETRDQLAQLEKESWVNEFIEAPREDNEERDLVKPKGFDGTRHRVLVASLKLDDAVNEEDYIVPDPEMSDSSSDGDLLYSHDEPIDFFMIIDAMREKSAQILRTQKLKLAKMLPLDEVNKPKFELPKKIASGMFNIMIGLRKRQKSI